MSKNKDIKELKKYFNEWEKEVIDSQYLSEPTKNFLLNHKKSYSYIWSKEALKIGMTLKEIKKIEKHLDFFYSETNDGLVIRYYNGFVAAGILEIPDDHRTKDINPIMIFGCGHNKECDDIETIINIRLTLSETENLAEVLNVCIEKIKEINKGIKNE